MPSRIPRQEPTGCALPVSVVIVAYNVRDLLLACLRSLQAEEGELVVVDNASRDGTVEAVRALGPGVRLIVNASNEGFARASNQALREARGRYLCLLNPDTEVHPGALARLKSALDDNPCLGIVGPRLLNPDGSLQSAGLRFPTWWDLAAGALPWGRPVRLPRKRGQKLPGLIECDWVLGACLMVRREVLEEIGLLDEKYFMYGEEKDLCYRAKQAGWQVACVLQARVVHHGGQSAEQAPVQSYLAFLDSQFHFLNKFYPPRAGRLFAQANWVGCRLRQLAASLLSLLQPVRREQWQRKAELARAGAHRCAAYLREHK